MLVKISWDDGSSFEPPCDLRDCYPDDDEGDEFEPAPWPPGYSLTAFLLIAVGTWGVVAYAR
jgi:hypothetical protein